MKTRRYPLFFVMALLAALLSPVSVPPALAGGSPNISLSKDMPPEVLLGATIPVTLTVSNPSGPNGFNLTFNDVLPVGVSYVGGSSTPEPTVIPQPDGTTVLVWENVADTLTGTTVTLDYEIATGPGFDVSDNVTNSANAYASSNARILPVVNPATGAVTGGFTGFDDASDTTTLIPFELTKTEPSAEAELLRGVHDHQTVYTLTVDNNFINPSSTFSIVDYLPAGLEFLGCGTVDNSTGGDEYAGSGPVNPGNAPPMTNPCIPPSSVTTVTTDPDAGGPLPSGVYTRVEWDAAALGTSLAAGASFSMDYIAAIPLYENVQATLADPTANLDNNTGALTTETEAGLTNYAVATGTYNADASPSSDDDTATVIAEDLSIHKTVDSETFVQGDTPVFTLLVETSEYAVSTGPITVTDSLPSNLDFTGSTPPADSAVTQPDGTTLITWVLPGYSDASSSTTITINTEVRDNYRNGDGTPGTPVASNDSHTNTTELSGDVTILTAPDGSTSVFPLDDESEASQQSFGPTILKEVSEPVAGGLTCGDGAGIAFNPTSAGPYRPGDRVCFRLNIDFPSQLDTLDPKVLDFLPDGFTFESWAAGSGSAIATPDMTFTNTEPLLTWELDDQDVGAVHVEIVISTIISDPTAASPGDELDNLMKLSYINSNNGVFQDRDKAIAVFSTAILDLGKGVIALNGTAVPGAPADNVTVQEGDLVTYQLEVSNIGTEIALDTSIRDVLPPGITCGDVSAISNGGACDAANGWIQWDTADNIDIAPSTSALLTYVVTVPVGTSAGASLVNTAGVRTYGGDTNSGLPFTYVPDNNIDPTLTPNADPADDTSEIITALPTLTKAVTTSVDEAGNDEPAQATIGETLTYTIDVNLPAGATYYTMSINDIVDADKDVIESTVSASLDGGALPSGITLATDDATNTITVTFPALYAIPNGDDQQVVLTFDAVVIDDAANVRGATSSNTADLNFTNVTGDMRNATDTVDVEIVEPNIVLAKSNDDVDGTVSAGQTLIYTLDVTNDSGAGDVSVAHDTQIVDTIPPELIVMTSPGVPAADGDPIAPDNGTWDESARTITWTIAAIDPGATTSLTYEVETQNPLVAAGTVMNTAEADTASLPRTNPNARTNASTNGDADGDGYQDDAQSSVVVPVLDLAKSVTPATATVGEAVEYTLVVSIPGGVIAYDTTVIDDLPAGVTYESLTSISCIEGGGVCTPDLTTASADVVEGSGDVAFFFDDLTPAAAGDRDITIVYVAVVDDVAAANDGSNLENTAAVYWNAADTITSTPATPPSPGTFDGASTPSSADIDTREPTLIIDKAVAGQNADDDNRRAVPNETLSYTITLTNTGTSPAYNATVSDTPTDDTWAFADTTTAAGVTNTDSTPAGGLEWTIDGPIAPGASVTITYDLTVPASYDSSNEVAGGPEQTNTADIPSYFGVAAADRLANPGRTYREYDDVVADVVDIELDLASIGDRLWFDVNNDGIQDPGELPIANVDVTVTYLGPDGVAGGGDDEVFTATTDANGDYLVENLPGGAYTVVVDQTDPDFPPGLVPSYDLDDTTISPDGQWAGVLGEDEDKLDVDFGYTGTGSIGDTLWLDQNGDGVIDANEGRVQNVDVDVTWFGLDGVPGGGDDVVYSATTDANGNYLIENLPPGNYIVEVDPTTIPVGYNNVADPNGGLDNTSALPLGIGEANLDQDFGYAGTGSIGDTIWLDQNNDGVQDGTEPGIGGVTVELTHFGADGVPGGGDDSTFTTTTDADGMYLFDDLPPGEYQVEVLGGLPSNGVNSFDPDIEAPGDSISTLTLTDNENNLDQDFGYYASSVLGDRVWWDINSDGIQDPDEPGLNNIEVTATYLGPDGILGTVDDETFTTTTTTDGDYLFSNIPDGDYIVDITNGIATGLTPTFDEDSGLTTPDQTTNLTLTTSHLTADFGYVGTGTIGDTIWYDTNLDGTQDPNEFPLEGITVELTWLGPDGLPGGNDDITLTTTTDTNGNYLFDGLPAGDYTITVDETTLPTGTDPTADNDGGLDNTSAVTLTDGETNLDQDFGYAGTGTIGDTIWLDQNNDGTQDPDEQGLGGITVTLTWDGPTGPETFTTTTDANGNYLFENLPAGDFTITIDPTTLPAGTTQTFDTDGTLDNTSTTTLTTGETNLDQDFGYVGDADIGDTIWLDLNGDGIIDPNEPSIPNQTVELTWQTPTGPVVFTTTTDADGNYLFPNLPDGDYTIAVIGGIVDVASNTGEPGTEGDSTNDITITGGADNLEQDFGYQGPNSIGDQVWVDYNLDGIVDPNEPGIENVQILVTWFGPDGVAGGGDDIVMPIALTDADGNYLVEGLPDGSYSVDVVGGIPIGIDTATYDADDGTTSPDSSSIVTDLGVGTAADAADIDQDFGYIGAGSIGDTIWLNLDADDEQDPNEPGLPGITVTLTGAGADGVLGTADDVVYPPQITDADGMYLFENLPPGPYDITYDTADLAPGLAAQVDLDGGALESTEIDLPPNTANLDVDFGVAGTASLSGVLFVDSDGDGVVDPGEAPIPNVTVIITWDGPDGPVEFTVVTDENGDWELPNIPPGDYTVEVDLDTVPAEYLPTIPTITEVVVPPGGVAIANNGFVPEASIGDRVWRDDNRNGEIDSSEQGLEGITVNLLDADGNIVATTTTATDGTYLFAGLLPGTYSVSLDTSTFPSDMSVVSGPNGTNTSAPVDLAAGADIATIDFGLDLPDPAPSLAFTGRTVLNLVLTALVLMLMGSALVATGRRRKTAA